MRIALVTDSFSTGGGLEHIYQITRGMPDIQFGVFGKGGQDYQKFQELANVIVYREGYHASAINAFRPDLIHIHHLKPLWVYFQNLFVRREKPVLFTIHGMHIHKYEFRHGLKSSLEHSLRFRMEKYLYNRVTRLITVSRGDLDFLRSSYKVEHGIYIPNGLDFSKINVSDSELAGKVWQTLQLSPHCKIFLTVARFDFPKAYDVLLKAIAIVKSESIDKNLCFILVGDGPLLGEMKKLAKNLNIDDIVHFPGKMTGIERLLKASDVFILPSRWEGLPITLLEAGALKLPVIASDTYGIREVISDGENGFLFRNEDPSDLASVIRNLLTGRYDTEAAGMRLFERIHQEYDSRKALAELKSLYLETASRK